MPHTLHALIVEDNRLDVELLTDALEAAGFGPQVTVVQTEAAFSEALAAHPDVILADFNLPHFGAPRALQLLREAHLDIPFIVVSGALSDDMAIKMIRAGASDYLLKDRLGRLGPAILRALEERSLRRKEQAAHQALKRSEALNRAVLQSMAAHITVLDAQGQIIMMTEPWAGFASDPEGRHFLSAPVGTAYTTACQLAAQHGMPHAAQVQAGIDAVLSGIQPLFTLEYVWYGGGQRRWFLMQVTPLEDQGGVVVLHENITKLRLADEALRESEGRWRGLVASHPETILIVNADSQITYINKAGAQVFGAASADQLLGQSMFRFLEPESHDVFRKRLANMLAGQTNPPIVYKLVRLDGAERDVEAFSVPIQYNGRPAAQTVFRDVTDRRRFEQGLIAAKEEAEEVAKLRSTILTNMSHEIRTPLTTILGFAEVLSQEVEGEHKLLVQLIQRGGRRLSDTLNSVLDLARLESGSMVLRPERIDMIAEVADLVTLFIPLAEEKHLHLSVTPPSEPTWADVDVAVLSRIVHNLVGNAIKFTDEGRVNVTVRALPQTMQLTVQDTGIGIDAEFIPHLFDEFKQESTGITRSHEGSGLGLNITQRLVHLSGGSIKVESKKGHGSAFTVTLPRYHDSPRLPRVLSTMTQPLPPPVEARVLAVEDNRDTQVLIRVMLDECRVTPASSGAAALAAAEAEVFDAVLMDINLEGDMNGTQVLRALRERPRYEQVPIIAVTAYALPGDRDRFLRMGFDDYLSKPFTRKQLVETIARVLNPEVTLAEVPGSL